MVPGCQNAAKLGEDWKQPPLGPIEGNRHGIQVQLSVEDIAVAVALCEEHANELTKAAWEAASRTLDSWGRHLRGAAHDPDLFVGLEPRPDTQRRVAELAHALTSPLPASSARPLRC